MANEEQVERLRQNVDGWNKWREENPDVKIDLRKADLVAADPKDADLKGADLMAAILRDADLRGADLRRALLWKADLNQANLIEANLRRSRNSAPTD